MPAQPAARTRSSYLALQPSIQSAPAVPRPGQAVGQFPAMSLPSLPPTMGQSARPQQPPSTAAITRRAIPGQVPPTPTTMRMQTGTTETASVRLSQPTNPSLAVPGNGFHLQMPATPATAFHSSRPQGSSAAPANATAIPAIAFGRSAAEKQAFLAPFEQFYDALADARVLKGWFGEQLNRVGKVVRDVETEKVEVVKLKEELLSADVVRKAVADAVVEATGGWKDELLRLRARVAELESTIGGSEELLEGSNDTVMVDAERRFRRPPATNGLFTKGTRGSSPRGRASFISRSDAIKSNSGGQAYPPPPPGVDSYTFPPAAPAIPIAPTKSAPAMSNSGLTSSPPENQQHQHRSVSPLLRMSLSNANANAEQQAVGASNDSAAAAGGRLHASRSLSHSEASSPAPTEHNLGRGMTVSVSAMRLEPPPSPKGDSRLKGDDSRIEGSNRPSLKRNNTTGSHAPPPPPRGPDTPSVQSRKRSKSPTAMDEN